MAKNIDELPWLKRLFEPKKTWAMAMLFITGRQPLYIDDDVILSLIDEGRTMKLEMDCYHPIPQTPEDQQRRFRMVSYVELSQVWAVDYYQEQKILVKPETGKIIT